MITELRRPVSPENIGEIEYRVSQYVESGDEAVYILRLLRAILLVPDLTAALGISVYYKDIDPDMSHARLNLYAFTERSDTPTPDVVRARNSLNEKVTNNFLVRPDVIFERNAVLGSTTSLEAYANNEMIESKKCSSTMLFMAKVI